MATTAMMDSHTIIPAMNLMRTIHRNDTNMEATSPMRMSHQQLLKS